MDCLFACDSCYFGVSRSRIGFDLDWVHWERCWGCIQHGKIVGIHSRKVNFSNICSSIDCSYYLCIANYFVNTLHVIKALINIDFRNVLCYYYLRYYCSFL